MPQRLLKHFSRRKKQTTFVAIGALRVSWVSVIFLMFISFEAISLFSRAIILLTVKVITSFHFVGATTRISYVSCCLQIKHTNPWYCFLCSTYSKTSHGGLNPRKDWQIQLIKFFQTDRTLLVSLKPFNTNGFFNLLRYNELGRIQCKY